MFSVFDALTQRSLGGQFGSALKGETIHLLRIFRKTECVEILFLRKRSSPADGRFALAAMFYMRMAASS